MLRRLLELSRALGGQPQVILSTATIGNPAQFARELSGAEVTEVRDSGAARHGKRFYLADHQRAAAPFLGRGDVGGGQP